MIASKSCGYISVVFSNFFINVSGSCFKTLYPSLKYKFQSYNGRVEYGTKTEEEMVSYNYPDLFGIF